MGKVNFTESQKRAIYFEDKNLLLSAAAGSGKTACLSARIVELVGQGRADISEMLIVTFTKAATAEMRSRIASAMRNEAAECRADDPARAERLRRNAGKIGSAEISTIHSFLYKNIRKYFPAVGFPSDSKIIDEVRAKSIKKRIIKQIVNSEFEKTAESESQMTNPFVLLANTIGITRDSEKIDEEILWMVDKIGDDTYANEYTSAVDKIADGEDLFDTVFGVKLKKSICDLVRYYTGVFEVLSRKIAEYPEIDKKYRTALDGDLSWCRQMLDLVGAHELKYDVLKDEFLDYSPARLGSVGEKHKNELCADYKHIRDLFKKDRSAFAETYFCYSSDENRRSAEKMRSITRVLYNIAREYREQLEKIKVKNACIEYDDLERIALKLFVDENGQPTAIAREIGEKYKYIFVDEYQDTNDVQDKIFTAISENSVRFMVGDIKQSIYRFRGAEPDVFKRYRDEWGKSAESGGADSNDFDSRSGESIFLSENFRCDGPVIDFTNAVSHSTLTFGGIGYLTEDDLIKGKRDGGDEPVDLILIDKKSVQNETDDGSPDAIDEASVVAQIVRDMVGRYSYDAGKIVRPSDFAIIMRSPGASAERYKAALGRFGIPVNTAKESPAEDFASVKLLICLLNFVDNPLREVYTAGALISPVFSFTPAQIVALRRLSDGFLFKTVSDIAHGNIEADEEICIKCERVVRWYDAEKTIVGGISLPDYIEYLINNNELNSIPEVIEDPLESSALRSFAERAREFENGSLNPKNRGLSAFLRSLREDEIGGQTEGKKSTAEDSDAVSILSIHASKGLEYPVCIIAECGKKRNSGDETGTILVDKKYGAAMMLPSEKGLERYDNIFRRMISSQIRDEAINEEMRMLYVALTRARNKLILTASVSDADKKLASASVESEYCGEYLIKNKSSYVDWLLDASFRGGLGDKVSVNVIRTDRVADDLVGEADDDSGDDVISEREDEYEIIRARIEKDPYDDYLAGIPSKLPVSDLRGNILDKGADDEAEDELGDESDEIEKPSFMIGERFATAADRGNAVHLFMQFADFDRLKSEGFEAEANRLIEKKFISVEQYELINRRQIERFIGSSLLDKITRSPLVKREFRFNALLDASRFTEKDILKRKLDESGTKITIQGVVDCVFRDPDSEKLVLVDYKTDSLSAEEWENRELAERKLRERHRNQLTYYREICSEMFCEEIEEVYVYSTVLGRLIEIY
ncbi:MAG: hypothetical protein E7672_00525 [Ruminococcaceae bacterium]|nr:hypothetical protein [Oscillospiraceae bacterium]